MGKRKEMFHDRQGIWREKLAQDYRDEFAENVTVDSSGLVRWKSNNSVPPEFCLIEFDDVGCEFNMEICRETRQAEDDKFLALYRERMKNRVYTDEERFEMRAAFGEGAVVVNVITGKRVRL